MDFTLIPSVPLASYDAFYSPHFLGFSTRFLFKFRKGVQVCTTQTWCDGILEDRLTQECQQTYLQRQKSLLRAQPLDIWANSVSKRNPFAGITTANQLWCAFSLINFSILCLCCDAVFCYTDFTPRSRLERLCMSRWKPQEGKTLPKAMHILGNLVSCHSYPPPLSVKAVQNPISCWASNAPERKP